jgi:hypothetical protein
MNLSQIRSKQLAVGFAAAVLIVGLSAFVRGVSMAWRPAGWMVAGLLVAAPALFWLYKQFRKGR